MEITFTKQRDYVYTLKLELPYSNEEMLELLQQETWEQDRSNGYQPSTFTTRHRLHYPKNPILKEIQKWVTHGNLKQKLLSTLYQESFWSGLWGVSQERMDSNTLIYGTFIKDRPRYNLIPHTDDRIHVLQGMIYFIPTDDPNQSTMCYTTREGSDPLRIPTGHGLGYFAANSNNSWHAGKNASDQDRYSLIYGIRLNLN